ncbi:MAG: aminotransferase class I/II-fold pyridoxal phosphate-dependent enzyme [Archangium sp.]|nr:aminotransferase class I/II-fold pyridoxal phosphate-dependent enzyme [Archangium sp.]
MGAMTHEEFLELRERLRTSRPGLIDCAQLNVYRSLAARFPAIAPSEHKEAPYRCHLAERFLAHLQLPAEWKSRTHVTHGVRRSLAALFQVFARDGVRVAIPADVYPVYVQLARDSGVRFTTFTKFPSELEACDAVLFCEPAKPWGSTLNADQLARLLAWSRAKRGLVLLDSAYATPPTSGAMQLVHEGAAMLLASLSKGWLIPDHGGICITPPGEWFERTRATFTALPKDAQKLRIAFAALTEHAQRPTQVGEALSARARVLDELTTMRPELNTTRVQGYFAVSTRSFDELLGLGVLGVPASVFGSTERLTILSSLEPERISGLQLQS